MASERSYNAAADFLDRNVTEGRGDKLAYIDDRRRLTYGELLDAAARVGPMLARLGVERENRVALVVLDCVEFPILFWGALRAGIVPVLLNTRLTADQYHYLLNDCRAKVALASTPLMPTVVEASRGVATLRSLLQVGTGATGLPSLERLLEAEAPAPPADTCADEVAYWLYSSGTTGNPKGVMHVQTTPRFATQCCAVGRIGLRESDVVFSAAKMFFSYGLGNSVLCSPGVGATAVLHPGPPTPQSVFEVMRLHQPTVFYAVPTLYASILADPACTPEAGSRRLRLCFSAGEPLPAHIGEAWKARYGLDIVNGVGSTEMGHLFLTNLPERVEYGTAGVPVEGFDVRLVDENGREVAAGELGELLVRGPTAAAGYWNQRERTRRTFEGEWTRTGDKYERRADGIYIYHGCTDDLFKVSGIWVSPFEVEAALVSHPRVLEAAVVPFENEDGLVKPKAFVVLRDTPPGERGRALYEELKVHVKREIGVWKYPRWIEFVDGLPRTATGKLQRYKLRELGRRPPRTPPAAPDPASATAKVLT